jgi:hypothetical protein
MRVGAVVRDDAYAGTDAFDVVAVHGSDVVCDELAS